MNPILEAAYIAGGAAIVAAIIVGVLTYLKRDNASQSSHGKGNGQALNATGSGNAVNAGGNVHIGDVITTGNEASANVYQAKNKKYSRKPLPQEIASDVNNHPPFQQEEIAKHYYGLLVQWEVKVSRIESRPNNSASVLCHVDNPHVAVCFIASLEEFPQLKITKRYSAIWVSGEIENFASQEIIYLKDVSLSFDKL